MPTHWTHKQGVQAVLKYLQTGFMTLKLFKNNFTPNQASILEDFVEATFLGYVPYVPGTLPDFFGFDGANNYWAEYAEIEFEALLVAVPETIYGWYIVINLDGTEDHVFMSHRFDNPVNIAALGDKVRFNLALYCGDLTTV